MGFFSGAIRNGGRAIKAVANLAKPKSLLAKPKSFLKRATGPVGLASAVAKNPSIKNFAKAPAFRKPTRFSTGLSLSEEYNPLIADAESRE